MMEAENKIQSKLFTLPSPSTSMDIKNIDYDNSNIEKKDNNLEGGKSISPTKLIILNHAKQENEISTTPTKLKITIPNPNKSSFINTILNDINSQGNIINNNNLKLERNLSEEIINVGVDSYDDLSSSIDLSVLNEPFYCKFCDKTFPPGSFKNRQSFGAHCSNCSRKRKQREEGYVPELNTSGSSITNTSTSTLSMGASGGEKRFKKNQSTIIGGGNSLMRSSSATTLVKNLMNSSDYDGEDGEVMRISSSSPYSPGLTMDSSPIQSPQLISNIAADSLRFGLLDVVEDKIVEENELEFVKKDLNNVQSDIVIQDMKREKDISELKPKLAKYIKETLYRCTTQIRDRGDSEIIFMDKAKEEIMAEYKRLENELDIEIDKVRQSQQMKLQSPQGIKEIVSPSSSLLTPSSNTASTSTTTNINNNRRKLECNDTINRLIRNLRTVMNEKIVAISTQLLNQSRELERGVMNNTKDTEKYINKKFETIKNELNDYTENVTHSFDIIDNIILNQ